MATATSIHAAHHTQSTPQPNRNLTPSSKPTTPSPSARGIGGIRHLQLPPRHHRAPLPQAQRHEGRLLLLLLCRRRRLRIIPAHGLLLVADQEDGRGAAASGEGSLLPPIRVSEWAGG
ncbi:Os06g0313381 [Oryza sativa Japonica Group]|uniref:Os06g0313381 protein n=1 Tax=Oryza sativa subsp. japonica TaxID=39947 RepID=A0A0P0WVU6_ORYSJ|nr:Os06g0313381 [Oryza sativa Japonica Group]